MTTSPNKMSDEELREVIISIVEAEYKSPNYTPAIERVENIMHLIKQDREAYADEVKLDFANDMLKMNKWNEQARTDELYKIIRQIREKVGRDDTK